MVREEYVNRRVKIVRFSKFQKLFCVQKFPSGVNVFTPRDNSPDRPLREISSHGSTNDNSPSYYLDESVDPIEMRICVDKFHDKEKQNKKKTQ